MKRTIRRAILAALAALLGACSLYDYSSVTTNKYALVYGVTTYVTPLASNAYNDPNLSYPHLDASDVAAMLTAQGYTVKSRWVDADGYVYVDGVKGALVSTDSSAAPSKSVIESDLAALTDTIGSTDQFLFYFSGHGMQDDTVSPAVEYFIPYGGIQAESVKSSGYTYTYYYGDGSTSVDASEMGTLLSTYIPTSRKIVILDTCNSGGFISNNLEVDTTPSETTKRTATLASVNTLATAISNYASFSSTSSSGVSPYNATVLSASGADESCYDDSDHEHGAMTYYLLQTPSYADLNGDGSITIREAFSWVKAAITENWNVTYSSEAFTPHISGGPVDYVLF